MSKKLLIAIVLAAGIAAIATPAVAVPLPDGTLLSITTGTGSLASVKCSSGSCFSMLSGSLIWTDFGPGTDGGILLGKDQQPGSLIGGPEDGELTSLWKFFGNNGTNASAPFCSDNNGPAEGGVITCVTTGADENIFDDASCSSNDACADLTVLGSWHVGWNGVSVPMGSALGCLGTDPTDACLGVTEWTVIPSPVTRAGGTSTYVLSHAWQVPTGDPSGFGNVFYSVLLEGSVTLPPIECAVATQSVDCDDNVVCTEDTCDSHWLVCKNESTCDDSSVCTTDSCDSVANECVYTDIICDDNEACTTDTCDAATGCVHTAGACEEFTLVSPADGQTGLGSMVEFRWKKYTGATSYDFYNCANDPTASCNSVAVTAQLNSKGLFYAGGAGLLLIGMTFIGGLRGRKMMVLLFVMAVVFAGGTLLSCSDSSDDTGTTPLGADEVQHFATGLSPNTTYYWKVSPDNGLGSTVTSTVQSFTTL